ncbi:MAG: tryptophan-rich sensory protein [Chlamydiia bacterium]|nr:tryptophan-rich sensory protein [Chlamydiia bacterium]
MKISTIVIVLLVLLTLFLGGEFTKSGMEWYKTLNKPYINPPGTLISFVWLVLFTLIAICLIRVWNLKPRPTEFKSVIILFAVNGVLNMGWSYLFFSKQLMLTALFEMSLLWLTICALIYLIRRFSHLSAFLLIPYALWVLFAGYLNFELWRLNG